ncbi:MAG: sulfite exporter TauE/SafE family protein [Candidatus Thermoplasmatota archaeon]|nr:sulfite exporter TauE/SafE family protein [Candidatus Thermoplasmatota archaeon]
MNRKRMRTYGVVATVLAALMVIGAVLVWMQEDTASGPEEVQPFTATDYLGRTFSLLDFSGHVTVLHVTQIENPLCIECEQHITAQITELNSLAQAGDSTIDIVTLNVRKNSYSEAGWEIAEEYYGLNISWYWVEEFEPFPAASQFIGYWELRGGFANPTIILIDHEQRIAAVHNVYCVGTGEVDGVVTAGTLASDSRAILSGDWDYDVVAGGSSTAVTFGSMFLLGAVTSFSPCSIALLMAMISYIGALRSKRAPEEGPTEDMTRGVMIGLAFTIGMALIFLLMGIMISYIGGFIEMSSMFYLIAGIILIVLGINSIKPLSTLLLWLRDHGRHTETGPTCAVPTKGRLGRLGNDLIRRLGLRSRYAAAFLLGVLFSVGWAPCALSLIFPVIVLVLAHQSTLVMGGAMMFVFGLGHGVIIVPFCGATGVLKGSIGKKYVGAGSWMQLGFGTAIIAIGAVFALRYAGVLLW